RLAGSRPRVELVVGDGRLGHPPGAPFDAICVAAAARELPGPLSEQLAEGGRVVVPLRHRRRERLVLFTRVGARLVREDLEEVRFVPLVAP
ncbi:MAG: protein-L-isoaspartate O-methyltransferase, partial [Solirubrobacterales bacterium]|nr:protein-L-isoaspartate O-methyltransferase [Solirubrobacterales bacterium]